MEFFIPIKVLFLRKLLDQIAADLYCRQTRRSYSHWVTCDREPDYLSCTWISTNYKRCQLDWLVSILLLLEIPRFLLEELSLYLKNLSDMTATLQ